MKAIIYFKDSRVRDIENFDAVYMNRHVGTYDIRFRTKAGSLELTAIPVDQVARLSIIGGLEDDKAMEGARVQ